MDLGTGPQGRVPDLLLDCLTVHIMPGTAGSTGAEMKGRMLMFPIHTQLII